VCLLVVVLTRSVMLIAVTPKVEPPDNSAANVTGVTETAKSTSASSQDLSHVTVTASPTRSAAQPIILNIMPLVQDGS